MNLNAKIDELWANTKAGKMPRQERFVAIEELTEEYIRITGKRPEPAQLDRLATLCLYEEVTDNDLHKSRNQEFPFQSERQEERREAQNKPLMLASEYGVDGKNHRKPTRKYR